MAAPNILSLLQGSGLIKNVKQFMVTHRNVIIGSELVSFLISSRVCSIRADAVDLCNHLIMDEILQHEFQEHIFKDKYLFYVITPEAHSNACAIGLNSESDSDDEIQYGARRSSLAGFGGGGAEGESENEKGGGN